MLKGTGNGAVSPLSTFCHDVALMEVDGGDTAPFPQIQT
jgi:hypothetical protein